MIIPRVRLLAGFLFCAVLAGGSAVSAASEAATLDGTAWVLAALPGRALVKGSSVTLSFEGGRVSGSDGCNRYTSPYSADGAKLRIEPNAAQNQSLTGTTWRVTGLNNGRQGVVSVLDGSSLTMEFAADGKLTGSAGCNRFHASYTREGAKLSIGAVAATRRQCEQPAGAMEQEQQFLKALQTVTTVRAEGDRLELHAADGALAVELVRNRKS